MISVIKKSENKYAVFLLSLMLVFSGCGSEDDGGEGTPPAIRSGGVILPLEIGNTWTHAWIIGSSSSPTTTSVSAVQTIAGDETYKTGTSTLFNFYRNHEDGLYNYGTEMEIHASPRLYLKYPCSVGDTWTYDGGTFRVMSTSASIASDVGTLDCIEYYYSKTNSSGTFNEHFEYWHPGIGQVLQYVYLDGELLLTIELKEYTVDM